MFCSSWHERGTLILFTRKIFIISSTLCNLFNLAIRVFHSSLSQPPSNSNKKKQKELKDPKMPKQTPPRRRVVVDSDEEMGPKSARNGDSQAVRVSLSISLSFFSDSYWCNCTIFHFRPRGKHKLSTLSDSQFSDWDLDLTVGCKIHNVVCWVHCILFSQIIWDRL